MPGSGPGHRTQPGQAPASTDYPPARARRPRCGDVPVRGGRPLSTPIALFRAGRAVVVDPDAARERSVRRRVGLTWGLLVLNALGYIGTLVQIPGVFGKVLTQGALPAAVIVALTVNRRVMLRPNVFLCLVSLLPVGALVTACNPSTSGPFTALSGWPSSFRTVAAHAMVGSTGLAAGPVSSDHSGGDSRPRSCSRVGRPGSGSGRRQAQWRAVGDSAHAGRALRGGHLRAWLPFCGCAGHRAGWPCHRGDYDGHAAPHAYPDRPGRHDRGLMVAGLSLIVAKSRVRKLFAALGVSAIAIMTLFSVIVTFLARGQGSAQLTNLTGRTMVWRALLVFPRDKFQEIFGFGLSNDSFNGLPIDSNWLVFLPGAGAVRGGRLRADAALPAGDGLLPAPRCASRACPVPGHILPGCVVHRSRLHGRDAVPP